MKKLLFVVTSHTELGSTGRKTGFHFSEMGEPYAFLRGNGYAIDFVSPLGGAVRADGYDEADPLQKQLMEDDELQSKLADTLRPADIDPDTYAAIYYVGGHGTMWDFADNLALQHITSKMFEDGKGVAAVCHGPAGLVNVKLSDGSFLVKDKNLAAFSDDEERAINLDKVMPFLLESALVARGAKYTKHPLWQENIEVDKNLITGQNPASALSVGKALHEYLTKTQ
ncbi:MAG TPA: type 1 glutamine amidotransferase domain-containing protein [Candidatus Saccharimonadia bacterium]|nr:type 1 glutamine amidotransferase domain-containing protein [Candidatus Saccharimonadia bacterium]